MGDLQRRFPQLNWLKRTSSNMIETFFTSWSFWLIFLSTTLHMQFLWLQSHQRDTWPGQNRWSWMCCSSPKVRDSSLWRPKKPLWRCRSAQISQAKRWLLRQKRGWSRTPPDTFPQERWAPCHSGPNRALCHIPGERREPAWQRVRDRLLAPWSEQESCANWSNQQPLGGLMWLYHLVQTNLSLSFSISLTYSLSVTHRHTHSFSFRLCASAWGAQIICTVFPEW